METRHIIHEMAYIYVHEHCVRVHPYLYQLCWVRGVSGGECPGLGRGQCSTRCLGMEDGATVTPLDHRHQYS